ncbi:MAG: hypothetical protein GKR92_01045 [Gammaproteobacteria bacterium]|nr:MAG: hypothetical protein GKR92_01045 [Gammaproteobacteria bacterium]
MFPNKKLLTLLLIISASLNIALSTETNDFIKDSAKDNKQGLIIGMYESLYNAIEMDSASEVEQLIAFGANIDHRNKAGITPLMLASSMGSINTVGMLLKLGADTDLTSKEGMKAIDFAHKANDRKIITILQANHTPEETSSERQLITTIQFYLNRLGYIAGNIDGVYGVKTRKSLKQFSIDYKQNFAIEISSRQVETLFHAMSLTNPIDIAGKEVSEESNLSEEIPTPVNVDFVILDAEATTAR